MKRGEIYWADLAPRSGSEQKGRRPVVIVLHDGFNQAQGWRSIIVVPITTCGAQAKRGLTAVALPQGTGGLMQDSTALCHQVTTLDRAKLSQHIGVLPANYLDEIAEGLKAALDIA